MDRLGTDRRRLLAEGAIQLLAAGGAHGLTHRRLDRSLGLPEGSASNVFPSRDALLAAALGALVARDLATAGAGRELGPLSLDDAAAAFAATIRAWLRPSARARLVARYELLLEASRRPALREEFLVHRAAFTARAEALAAVAGCADPALRAAELVAWADGVLLDHVAVQRSALGRAEVAAAVRRLLAA